METNATSSLHPTPKPAPNQSFCSELSRCHFGVMLCVSVGLILGSLAVKELKLSYHNPETISFTIYPNYGN